MHKMAQIDVTTIAGCSIRCNYCPQDKTKKFYERKNIKTRMSLTNFMKYIEKIPKEVQINFAGFSEPFLNSSCIDMILYAHQKQHDISLYTTLVGINNHGILELSSIPFISVNIHLPTSLGKENIPLTEKHGEKILLALKYLSNSSCVVMSFANNKSVFPISKYHPVCEVPINGRSGNLNDKFASSAIRKGILACDRKLKSNVLMPNGDVSICCQDFGLDHIIGSLAANSYEELFSSKEYIKIKNGLLSPESSVICRKCEYAINL